jgi:indole-3-glycerol phosphate synthase
MQTKQQWHMGVLRKKSQNIPLIQQQDKASPSKTKQKKNYLEVAQAIVYVYVHML